MTELANPREAHFAAEVPANHSQARGAAIHLVDLLRCARNAGFVFSFCGKDRFSSANGSSLSSLSAARLLPVQRDFVVRRRFRGQHFRREIERNARFRFRLILRQPFLQQLSEFRETLLQIADRVRIEREQSAVGECFDRSRSRRAIQDRKFAEEIAVAIKSEIAFRPVVGERRRARALFPE